MVQRRVEHSDIDELVAQARTGDAAAFGALAAHYQHEVYTLALRLVSDRTLAADVAQEAFIRAWRAIGRFRGDAAFSTWLHRITVNAAWTEVKRSRRHRAQPIDQAADQPDLTLGGDPERAGEAAVMGRRIRQAIEELPTTQRAVVMLKDVYGWSHKEIADALSISVTAAKVRLHRARQGLRDSLKETG